MSETWQIMVASSDLENRRHLVSILERQGLGTFCAANMSQCREILDSQNVGLVFCDRSFADGDYRDVLAATVGRKPGPKARVVLLAAVTDSEQYSRAKDLGVFEVISAACRPTDVEWMVIRAKRDEQSGAGTLVTSHAARAVGVIRERSHSARA
ncbi:MAG: response regulator [Candidatus Acidiferrales bacterium]